jgi:hypothetical protein
MSSRRTLMDASTPEKQQEAQKPLDKQKRAPDAGSRAGAQGATTTALDADGHPITDSDKEPGFNTSDYRRDVHAKSHGCAYGKFEVLRDIPARFAFGLFSHQGETYRSIVRFSSGKPKLNPDGVPDARGFAVKLLMDKLGHPADPANGDPVNGIEKFVKDEQDRDAAQQQWRAAAKDPDPPAGPQTVTPSAQAASAGDQPSTFTQDFVMINSKVFFIRTIEEYAAFSSALGMGKPMQYFFPSAIKPWTWHAREAALAMSSFKPRPESLVTQQYYSLSAYKLGPRQYVKYSVRPCKENKPKYPTYATEPGFFSLLWRDVRLPVARAKEFSLDPDSYRDYLRDELTNQLSTGSPCFEFLIQPQIPEKNMPIEDATLEWDETASPFIPVARLTLDRSADNNVAKRNQECENLSFNPWHALAENEPVGVMNRVRKAVYQGMSRYRREKNCEQSRGLACSDMAHPSGERESNQPSQSAAAQDAHTSR